MPTNQILEAFIQGSQQREQRERQGKEDQFKQQQLKQESDQFKAQLDATQKQHDLENARLDAAARFAQSAQELQQNAQLQEIYAKTGSAPGATVQTPSFSQPRVEDSGAVNAPIATDLSGTPQGQAKITGPFGSFNAVTPEQQAKIAAMQNAIAQEPILQRQEALARQGQQAASALEDKKLKNSVDLENIKTKAAKEIENLKITSERAKELNNDSQRLKEIELQNAGRLAAAKQRGVSDASANQALRISNQFDTNDITKRYSILKDSADFVNSIPNSTNQGSDDQALVYAFAKAMDPNSAVREGEYATVQKYAQTIADKFKFDISRINSGTVFLTPQARKEMKDTITAKTTSEKKNYNNLRSEVSKKLEAVGQKPELWLTDYTGKGSQTSIPSGVKIIKHDINGNVIN